MAKKVIEEKAIELEKFDGELEFECTGKSKHLIAGLKVKLRFEMASMFKRLGYIK